MKIFAPEYYKDFKCIADRCRYSCCVGWEIDVDREALSRFESLGDAGKEIIDSVDFSLDTPHFRLDANERCPHLDGSGLCRIISRHGEDYLCDICREHPRFYNFPGGRAEVGLGAACEEAARLILECDTYFRITEVGQELSEEEAEREFDAVDARGVIYQILSERGIPYKERLARICGVYKISPDILSDSDWRAVISELEYIDEKNKYLFLCYSSFSESEAEEYAERAFAYFIYRHTGSADTYAEFLISVGLALFLERLFVSLVQSGALPQDALRIISEEIEYSEENTERIKNEFL